ncbi:MAG: pilus assembly protein N-terminal domain-containing protein, partial [Alphaproteobacteria bacterium]
MSIKRRAFVILAALLLALALPAPVLSQTAVPASDTLRLEVRKGQLLQLPAPAKSVFVADPEIADVQVSSPNSVFVLGRRAGSTTLYALGADDNVIVATEVRVTQTLDEVTELLRQEFPDASLRLRSTPGGIIVQGRAFTAETAQSIIELANQFVGDDAAVINRIEVAAPAQVNLRVRVAEMSRQVAKELNVNFAG